MAQGSPVLLELMSIGRLLFSIGRPAKEAQPITDGSDGSDPDSPGLPASLNESESRFSQIRRYLEVSIGFPTRDQGEPGRFRICLLTLFAVVLGGFIVYMGRIQTRQVNKLIDEASGISTRIRREWCDVNFSRCESDSSSGDQLWYTAVRPDAAGSQIHDMLFAYARIYQRRGTYAGVIASKVR